MPPLRLAGRLVTYAYLAGCYIFIFLPVAVLVLFSFQDGTLPVPPFRGPTLVWYGKLFANSRLMDALLHSVVVGLVSAGLSVVLGFLAADGLARHRVPGQKLIEAVILLPLAVSYLLVGMGLLVSLSWFGLSPSLPIVVVGHVVINMPLAFAIVLAQLGEHQRRIEWAARDLGASTARILLTITVPLIAPALIAAFCLCFTLSWDEFLIAFLVTRFDVTLPVVIWTMLKGGLNPQINAAGSLIFLLSIGLFGLVELLLLRRRS